MFLINVLPDVYINELNEINEIGVITKIRI